MKKEKIDIEKLNITPPTWKTTMQMYFALLKNNKNNKKIQEKIIKNLYSEVIRMAEALDKSNDRDK